jgi:hypothetical protein
MLPNYSTAPLNPLFQNYIEVVLQQHFDTSGIFHACSCDQRACPRTKSTPRTAINTVWQANKQASMHAYLLLCCAPTNKRYFGTTFSFIGILLIFMDSRMSGRNMPAGPHENASNKRSSKRWRTARTKASELIGLRVTENMLQRAVSMVNAWLQCMRVAGVTCVTVQLAGAATAVQWQVSSETQADTIDC